jgi:hypothetical protein
MVFSSAEQQSTAKLSLAHTPWWTDKCMGYLRIKFMGYRDLDAVEVQSGCAMALFPC